MSSYCAGEAYCIDENIIRVAILQDADKAGIRVDGNYKIIDPQTGNVLRASKDLRGFVDVFKDRIFLDAGEYAQEKIAISVDQADSLYVNNRRYHGSLCILRKKKAITLVNYLPLEDYIKGIAVREISHYWPSSMLAAQAIVFRSYAFYQMRENAHRDYDLTGDVYSQVYGGTQAARYRISDAVDETAGDVLTYKGKIFPAFYHSTCGGRTQDASVLWDIDIEPLKGVECIYCRQSPHYSWKAVIPLKDAGVKLSRSKIITGTLKGAAILGLDASGRVAELSLTGENGGKNISAKDFRQILGPDVVKSANFSVDIRNKRLHLSGLGWGHGAGLCQWGAYFQAKAGFSTREILLFYYPGSAVDNIYSQKRDL
ncbi:MAG: SpoIID/LytB domain-containing protein [Candidatus Omnitrophica bacterium]|nr:SpoIID/LytB domain-containing protein [Candidatus Omnitrophota bacterium]